MRSSPFQATVDHIKSRPECASQKEHRAASNKVLACYGCNQRRNNEYLSSSSPELAEWYAREKPSELIGPRLPENPPLDNRFNEHLWDQRTEPTENFIDLVMQPPSWDIFSGGT